MLRKTTSKRLEEMESKLKRMEDAVIYTQNLVHSKLAEAVDKKYEFTEILECMDDILGWINGKE